MFVPVDEKSGALFAKRFGRGVVWTFIGLATLTGLRTWIWPAKTVITKSAPVPSGPTYPVAAAQAEAGEFAYDYLTWNANAPQQRAALLASVLPAGADTTMGWDGHGTQQVEAVQPGAVTIGTQGQARVRVNVMITSGSASATPQWVGLDVPVMQTGGGIVVTGEPGLVGLPATGPAAPSLTAAQSDSTLTATTQNTVDAFFRGYAAGTGAMVAPGAAIPQLPSGITYDGLTSWSVDVGSGDNRIGTALVSWTLNGATFQQTYRVSLTRVESATAATWQVATVTGGDT